MNNTPSKSKIGIISPRSNNFFVRKKKIQSQIPSVVRRTKNDQRKTENGVSYNITFRSNLILFKSIIS